LVRSQSIRQRPPGTGSQKSRFRGVPRAWLIERGGTFVEAACVPRILKPELLKIEVVAKLVTQRGAFLATSTGADAGGSTGRAPIVLDESGDQAKRRWVIFKDREKT
jgi:hypothetical protein